MAKCYENYCKEYAQSVATWVDLNLYKGFHLASLKFDYAVTRRSHRGGMYAKGPGINLAMRFFDTEEFTSFPRVFYEYPSFSKDKFIGSFLYLSEFHHVEAVILHEMAHAIQWYAYEVENFRCKPHGPVFKKYYKALREELLNDKLPEQGPLIVRYKEFITSLNTSTKTFDKFIGA